MLEPTATNHFSFTDAQMWVWNTKFGERVMYNLAYLSQDTLRICFEIKSKEAFAMILSELEAGTLPDNAFPKSIKTIPLNTVTELRCSETKTTLEIHQIGRSPTVICDKLSQAYRDIYQYLRTRLASTVQPVEGRLSWRTLLYAPCLGLFVTLIMGGLLIYFSTMANPNPAPRQGGFEMILDTILSFLGVWGTTGLVVVIAGFFILAIVGRIRNPIKAEVVIIQNPVHS